MNLIMPVLAGIGIMVFTKSETAKYPSFFLYRPPFKVQLKKIRARVSVVLNKFQYSLVKTPE